MDEKEHTRCLVCNGATTDSDRAQDNRPTDLATKIRSFKGNVRMRGSAERREKRKIWRRPEGDCLSAPR